MHFVLKVQLNARKVQVLFAKSPYLCIVKIKLTSLNKSLTKEQRYIDHRT